ncbi:hypothetical protein ASG87_13480 [Frateuria sp. Soil773]|uniref:hypothetical protein n=1 Tax=Frateuria sp. Soil773 TaxID=1736407 RepID=UPI0006F38925|nr:hypothetical protein [Frateuria sp. Soil773]KRE99993.1 hypothetical protein ASG87_13480 [Frateuria sp. Soil773]
MDGERGAGRRGWLDMLGLWRREALIDQSDEMALARHYDERTRDLEETMARIGPEYDRRLREDGREQANAWLVEQAEALGRADGEATRQALSSTR